jgi:phosphoglycerol geranylgeranyltransferase
MNIYSSIVDSFKQGKKQFAVLVDPDKVERSHLQSICKVAEAAQVDFFFVGSSLLTNGSLRECVQVIKENSVIPVVLFPGNTLQVCELADALLFLSLISGRNAEMLIGNHVIAAPFLRQSGLEVISTGYMLVEGGNTTSVQYMSNTTPIPPDKNDIALCTALAGEMLGMKLIFMDAGSGARMPVSRKMLNTVSSSLKVPLIAGGGINSTEKARESCLAGAQLIVVGNAIEQQPELIRNIADVIHCFRAVGQA